MITLITGVPGSGKTLYSIGLILDYIKEGRDVYADIDGLNIDGVLKSPDDWRETPDGSVVVYDECQQKYPPEGNKGRSEREDMAAFEVHRHTGHDIVLITQHPSLLHNHVRRLVGRHHHVSRVLGGNVAKIYTQDKVIKVDSRTDLNASDLKTWPYPKKHFDFYQSATVHTHKFKLPNKVKYGIAAMVALTVAVGFLFNASGLFHSSDVEPVAAVEPEIQPQLAQVAQKPEMTPILGCISSRRGCHCYNEDMAPIEMNEVQCLNTMARPLPRRVEAGRGRTSGAPRPVPHATQQQARVERHQIKMPRYVDGVDQYPALYTSLH
jgi:hypothetical protein